MAKAEKKTGASLARGVSNQVRGTPPEFIEAVKKRFGRLLWDLAATDENRVCIQYLGPGSPWGEDSLLVDWSKLRGNAWLNPPFGNIGPWAKKLAAERRDVPYFTPFLVPAAVGSNWFQRHCVPNSLVLELQDRLTFVGETQPYPKDLILCVFGFGLVGRLPWHWDANRVKVYERIPKALKAAQAAE